MTEVTVTTGADEDLLAIRRTIDAYGDHLRTADIAALVDLFTDDAVVLHPAYDALTGSAALAAAYEGALAAIGMDFTRAPTRPTDTSEDARWMDER